MKDIFKILVIFSVVLFTGCDNDDERIEEEASELVGFWINPEYDGAVIIYERADQLKDDDYGFEFKSNYVFIERKNSDWCGTPPISYADFKGKWERSESIVDITVGYWGGTLEYKWEIVSVDDNELKIVRIEERQP